MTDAVSTGEIASARQDMNTMLLDVCTIARSVTASDGAGGQTSDWQTVATGVPCRLAAASGLPGRSAESRVADRLLDATTHLVTFPAGTDVRNDDRVTVGTIALEVLLVQSAGALELTRPVQARITDT